MEGKNPTRQARPTKQYDRQNKWREEKIQQDKHDRNINKNNRHELKMTKEEVRELVKSTRMKVTSIAEICGVSYEVKKNYHNGRTDITSEVLLKLIEISEAVKKLCK